MLCSSTDIRAAKKLSYTVVDFYVDRLIQSGRLKVVFEQRKKIRLFAPSHIVEAFATARPMVHWLPEMAFPEKQQY